MIEVSTEDSGSRSDTRHTYVWAVILIVNVTIACLLTFALATALIPESSVQSNYNFLPWILDKFADVVPKLSSIAPYSAKLENAEITPSIAYWALGSLLATLLSLVGSMIQLLLSSGRRTGSILIAFMIGAYIVVAVVLSPLSIAVLVDEKGKVIYSDFFSLLALGSLLAAFVIDTFHWISARGPHSRDYLVAILTVSAPAFFTHLFFVILSFRSHPPIDFSAGVAAGILVFVQVSAIFLSMKNSYAIFMSGGNMNKSVLPGMIGGVINLVSGWLVQLFKLPIYLDTVGSMTIGATYGYRGSVVAAVVGTVLLALVTNPLTLAYVGTAISTGLLAAWLSKKETGLFSGFMTRRIKTVAIGALVIGPVSTLLSAPITTYVFSGVTYSGSDLVTAFFLSNVFGSLLTSVVSGAIVFDSIDRGLSALIAFELVARIRQSRGDRND